MEDVCEHLLKLWWCQSVCIYLVASTGLGTKDVEGKKLPQGPHSSGGHVPHTRVRTLGVPVQIRCAFMSMGPQGTWPGPPEAYGRHLLWWSGLWAEFWPRGLKGVLWKGSKLRKPWEWVRLDSQLNGMETQLRLFSVFKKTNVLGDITEKSRKAFSHHCN